MPEPSQPPRRPRKLVALAAALVGVPAFVAVAHAATGSPPRPTLESSAGVDATPSGSDTSPGTHERSGASTTSTSGSTSSSEHGTLQPSDTPPSTTVTPPEATEPTEPAEPAETEPAEPAEPAETEPGDDHGGDGAPSGTPAADPVTQVFTSAGGSIQVTLAGGVLTLDSTAPAAGFSASVHDAEPTRVEVRFSSGGVTWEIRVEIDHGAMVSEISADG